jgi:hypothetical protein
MVLLSIPDCVLACSILLPESIITIKSKRINELYQKRLSRQAFQAKQEL